MVEEKGNLLVSTKIGAGMKGAQIGASIVMLVIGLFLALNFKIFGMMGEDILNSRAIGVILGVVSVTIMFVEPVLAMIGRKSYCEVYEKSVVGITGLSLSHPNTPMQKFHITYEEIINVTESAKTLCIYTSYATYEILAMKNRAEAAREIRSRIGAKKQTDAALQ